MDVEEGEGGDCDEEGINGEIIYKNKRILIA